MATLETAVKEMRHEQSKLKDNERACMEIHGQQMLALTEEVAQQSKDTKALGEKLNEIEKLHNEQARKAAEIRESDIVTLQGTVKERHQEHNNMMELKSEVAKLLEANNALEENFRNESEKLRDNEQFGSLAGQLREMERGERK